MIEKKNKILLAVYSLTLVIRYHFIRHILIPNDYYLRSALVLSLKLVDLEKHLSFQQFHQYIFL